MTGLKRPVGRLKQAKVAKVPEFRLAPVEHQPHVKRVAAMFGSRGGQPVRVIDGTKKQAAQPKLKQSAPTRTLAKAKQTTSKLTKPPGK